MSRKLVVDSSVLIVVSRRGALEEYLKWRKREGYEVLVPRAIARELTEEPRKLAGEIKKRSPSLANNIIQSIEAVNTAIDQGLIRVVTVNYRKYSGVIDNVRKYLSQLEAKPEHATKKGDPELVALVIQLHNRFKKKVFISTQDKGLLRALKSFSTTVEYEILEN